MTGPKRKTLTLNVAPDRTAASLVMAIEPPDGYVFEKMERHGTKAVVTWLQNRTSDDR